jgi:hypothetical protein
VRKAQLQERERLFRIQVAAGVGFCWLEGTAAAPIFICSLTARINGGPGSTHFVVEARLQRLTEGPIQRRTQRLHFIVPLYE